MKPPRFELVSGEDKSYLALVTTCDHGHDNLIPVTQEEIKQLCKEAIPLLHLTKDQVSEWFIAYDGRSVANMYHLMPRTKAARHSTPLCGHRLSDKATEGWMVQPIIGDPIQNEQYICAHCWKAYLKAKRETDAKSR